MENKNYKEMIETAKKAVEGLNLDESIKLKAFEKVLDDLLGKNKPENQVVLSNSIPSTKKKRILHRVKDDKKDQNENSLSLLMNKLKAEDFGEIHNFRKGLDWSLYILQILKDKYSTDGLIPSEIATILSEKFRIKANQFGIGMALMKATQYVDRHKEVTRGGNAFKYRIMKKGEDYIKEQIRQFHNPSGQKAQALDTILSSNKPADKNSQR